MSSFIIQDQRTLRDLEAKNYRFSDEMLSVLLDDKKSNIVFGITYAFFTDSMEKTIDKHGRSRYWKKPFFFNGQHFYSMNIIESALKLG